MNTFPNSMKLLPFETNSLKQVMNSQNNIFCDNIWIGYIYKLLVWTGLFFFTNFFFKI
jgi:hypothetical protein